MKICSIIGTRPQIIKHAVMNKALDGHDSILIHTGQHYDKNMYQKVFDLFNIPQPDYNLHIRSGTTSYQIGNTLYPIEKILIKEQPDFVLVHGDCNSTLSGAIAASRMHIPLVHIEAGLRSYDKSMPEELNRVQTDHCSDILFAPTIAAIHNLTNENLSGILVGDIMYDSFLQHSAEINQSKILEEVGIEKNGFYLATVHRDFNTNNIEYLQDIFNGFSQLNLPIVFPIHPRTHKTMMEHEFNYSNLLIIQPVDYFDLLSLVSNSKAVLTDSGGITKEAYFCHKPCLVLRKNFEYPETKDWNKLVGHHSQRIVDNIDFKPNVCWKPVFGKGDASRLIVKHLEEAMG